MATIGNKLPTLLDVASRSENGKIAKSIVEILNETNEIIPDMGWVEANDGSAHKTTVRSGIPRGTWRKLNYGVQPTKSATVQISDTTGMLEAYAEIDKSLADLNGNTADWRLGEDAAHLEGMNVDFADTLFYGNTAINPERFLGLAPRFSQISGVENGSNIVDAGGTGSNNTSIWLIVWGKSTVHGIYPKGSQAGLNHKDLGEETLLDVNGGRFQGYRTHYKWDCGIVVRDWRYIVRIANVDVSNLKADAASGAKLVDLLVMALELIPNLDMGTAVFYMNRTVRSFLRLQMTNKSNLHLTMGEISGKKVMMFAEVPVRRVDAILNTEARIV